MPKVPRGKRFADPAGGSFRVVNKAPNGGAEAYLDRSRQVWVAPWRKPDGKVGKPTGKTRALAVASRDRHVAFEAAHNASRPRSPDHDYYTKVKQRHNGKVAAISVARQFARRCYHILRNLDPDIVYAMPT